MKRFLENPREQLMVQIEVEKLTLGINIHALRDKASLSIEAVAERSGVPVDTIQRAEAGRTGRITLNQLIRIAMAIEARLLIKKDK